jgi:hypothetical protein
MIEKPAATRLMIEATSAWSLRAQTADISRSSDFAYYSPLRSESGKSSLVGALDVGDVLHFVIDETLTERRTMLSRRPLDNSGYLWPEK